MITTGLYQILRSKKRYSTHATHCGLLLVFERNQLFLIDKSVAWLKMILLLYIYSFINSLYIYGSGK
ncbi:hypothetical protein Glove_319g59 [Diversispora epigaea]|uniref:Uncharacterized protein n=1 Tax=Diversispora epigaea TaxID=1348612 RepID=A0A397HPC9_9GLOM|nr:hypothetical protein Glove_319g59 [Diversispora epigaea]